MSNCAIHVCYNAPFLKEKHVAPGDTVPIIQSFEKFMTIALQTW